MRIDVPVIVRLRHQLGSRRNNVRVRIQHLTCRFWVKVWYNLVISDPFLLDESTDELPELTGSFFSLITNRLRSSSPKLCQFFIFCHARVEAFMHLCGASRLSPRWPAQLTIEMHWSRGRHRNHQHWNQAHSRPPKADDRYALN